jgi:hypothetical protein
MATEERAKWGDRKGLMDADTLCKTIFADGPSRVLADCMSPCTSTRTPETRTNHQLDRGEKGGNMLIW